MDSPPYPNFKFYSPMISPNMPIELGLNSGFSLSEVEHNIKNPFIIGICGGSCAGKSTITERLKQSLDMAAIVINEFDFYIPYRPEPARGDVEVDENLTYNYDDPRAIDWELFDTTLRELNLRRPTEIPTYSIKKHKRTSKTTRTFPTPVIIVEGMFILHRPEIRNQLDMKIFVDCPDDVRLGNRVKKFYYKYKQNLDRITNYYLKYTKPSYESYIETVLFT